MSTFLVGGWTNPFETYAEVKLDHETPRFRDENKKYLSCHHLDFVGGGVLFFLFLWWFLMGDFWWAFFRLTQKVDPRKLYVYNIIQEEAKKKNMQEKGVNDHVSATW